MSNIFCVIANDGTITSELYDSLQELFDDMGACKVRVQEFEPVGKPIVYRVITTYLPEAE